MQSSIEGHALQTTGRIKMSAVIKAINGFFRIDSDKALERHRSWKPINSDLQTVEPLKKQLVEFQCLN